MRKLLLAALGTCVALAGGTAASAEGGCGPGGHRGYYGHCRSNGPVIAGYRHHGHDYGYGYRYHYRHDRYRAHHGWRYR